MSTRSVQRHADWLGLVEPVGPFLTLPVLRRAWPDGLDRTGRAGELRERVEVLGEDDISRREFVEWVLRRLLAFGSTLAEGQAVPETLVATLPEHATLLRPDFAVVEPQTSRVRLLVSLWPARTELAAHLPGERWAASPVDRMATHLRLVGVELGLVTNGEHFCLVWAPRTGPVGRATWVASVFAEPAERTLLDSFTSVLGAKRFFAVRSEDQLEALLAESASAQAEVTNQLGLQVRRAVELLVAAFSRANRERGGALLAGLDPHLVYEAACTVLMRLVFLLSAEERRLLPLGDELYDRSYAVSTLRQALREVADAIGNDESLEHSRTAWPRLLATFRAVHGGLAHDELRLAAYGGRLFDPDRYPFLEGRLPGESWHEVASAPIPVDDRTMLGILEAVQVLQMREGGVTEARRLSFRSLDVEQIGHVYEGLLDHSARRVEEVTLGLVGKAGEEAEVTLSEVESHASRGEEALVEYLRERTKRSESRCATRSRSPSTTTCGAGCERRATTTQPSSNRWNATAGCCATTSGACRWCCFPATCTSPRSPTGATPGPSTPPRSSPMRWCATRSSRSCTRVRPRACRLSSGSSGPRPTSSPCGSATRPWARGPSSPRRAATWLSAWSRPGLPSA